MAEPFKYPSAALLAEVRTLSQRKLSAQELHDYVTAPMSDEEREGIDSLITWFRRRYPTPLQRLNYGRHAFAAAERMMPPALRRS
jgi:hypothetical protein